MALIIEGKLSFLTKNSEHYYNAINILYQPLKQFHLYVLFIFKNFVTLEALRLLFTVFLTVISISFFFIIVTSASKILACSIFYKKNKSPTPSLPPARYVEGGVVNARLIKEGGVSDRYSLYNIGSTTINVTSEITPQTTPGLNGSIDPTPFLSLPSYKSCNDLTRLAANAEYYGHPKAPS